MVWHVQTCLLTNHAQHFEGWFEQVTFEAEAFLIPLLNTSEVSLHKPTAKSKAYNMSWALWNWTRDMVITLLFLGTTDSLPIILWWQIEIEKRRWQVLVIQWRQWEKCKERVNTIDKTYPTLSRRFLFDLYVVNSPCHWYLKSGLPTHHSLINLRLHKDQRLDNVLSVKKGAVSVKFGHPER